ncbi:3-hydroxybutyryl-CoA dehydrogenase [Paenibacillus sp. Soil522]|uniref:3-hydroxybutyryl-CoA dehydrogenase n=1 Tax=Paenibacillus sp. Soil522 TaxID=1736388 RepID=UPI0006F37084|nr:3-hydroxybutyryl-CoA dehydrogenase [Paenibacillus sp. Soil522]KRE25217.1 3-hydroxybutyryl-CoA dehydrogenase [Paenibacillus sp. Soil522]
MTIRNVMVIGAGQMGSGIAQTLAQSGLQVTLYDIETAAVNQGISSIGANLSRLVAKGKMTEEQRELLLTKIAVSTDLESAEHAELVIEAAPEQMDTKKMLFRRLDQICRPNTILATNTSSLSITDIAAATKRPQLVIGMHFMNPVPVMPLVEIIRGLATSDETLDSIQTLALTLGKTPVEVHDFPGFVSNRILMPMINEAIYTVYEGVAEPEAVDQVMRLGMKHPMGPLSLADFIGLDTCLAIMETLHDGFGDSKYRPCPLLRKYVQAGWLGRKSGRGFYIYEKGRG